MCVGNFAYCNWPALFAGGMTMLISLCVTMVIMHFRDPNRRTKKTTDDEVIPLSLRGPHGHPSHVENDSRKMVFPTQHLVRNNESVLLVPPSPSNDDQIPPVMIRRRGDPLNFVFPSAPPARLTEVSHPSDTFEESRSVVGHSHHHGI